jgi:SP family myo-inositol transporter-like MFS transporter 13
MQPSALGTAAHAERATAAEREAQILAQVRPLELLALDGMRSADEETDTGAPLLSDERNYGLSGSHGDDGESAPAGSLAASRGDSGTWFIWALTLSAGLSGLLFGYEYVIIYLPDAIPKNQDRIY